MLQFLHAALDRKLRRWQMSRKFSYFHAFLQAGNWGDGGAVPRAGERVAQAAGQAGAAAANQGAATLRPAGQGAGNQANSWVVVAVLDHSYIALFSAHKQTHCARTWFYNEHLALYRTFMNIGWSGVPTVLTWLVPRETAAVLVGSVYTIQPSTMSLYAKLHT